MKQLTEIKIQPTSPHAHPCTHTHTKSQNSRYGPFNERTEPISKNRRPNLQHASSVNISWGTFFSPQCFMYPGWDTARQGRQASLLCCSGRCNKPLWRETQDTTSMARHSAARRPPSAQQPNKPSEVLIVSIPGAQLSFGTRLHRPGVGPLCVRRWSEQGGGIKGKERHKMSKACFYTQNVPSDMASCCQLSSLYKKATWLSRH